MDVDTVSELQDRAVGWHSRSFPNTDIFEVISKTVEELGEMARAVNAHTHPDKADRGSPSVEAAQVLVCLLIFCGRYLGVDLLALTEVELDRLILGATT